LTAQKTVAVATKTASYCREQYLLIKTLHKEALAKQTITITELSVQ